MQGCCEVFERNIFCSGIDSNGTGLETETVSQQPIFLQPGLPVYTQLRNCLALLHQLFCKHGVCSDRWAVNYFLYLPSRLLTGAVLTCSSWHSRDVCNYVFLLDTWPQHPNRSPYVFASAQTVHSMFYFRRAHLILSASKMCTYDVCFQLRHDCVQVVIFVCHVEWVSGYCWTAFQCCVCKWVGQWLKGHSGGDSDHVWFLPGLACYLVQPVHEIIRLKTSA